MAVTWKQGRLHISHGSPQPRGCGECSRRSRCRGRRRGEAPRARGLEPSPAPGALGPLRVPPCSALPPCLLCVLPACWDHDHSPLASPEQWNFIRSHCTGEESKVGAPAGLDSLQGRVLPAPSSPWGTGGSWVVAASPRLCLHLHGSPLRVFYQDPCPWMKGHPDPVCDLDLITAAKTQFPNKATF